MNIRQRLLLLCDTRGIKVADALEVARLVLDEAAQAADSTNLDDEAGMVVKAVWEGLKDAR